MMKLAIRAAARRSLQARPFSQALRVEEEDPLLSLGNEESIMVNAHETQIPKVAQDIYEASFQQELKDFCHEYQIPFLETNLPKSCRQAAKIFYRLKEDDLVAGIDGRYQRVVAHLATIPLEDIDEQFNPYRMREKWMKFFRSGFQRVLVDTDRALKNDLSDSLKLFIAD